MEAEGDTCAGHGFARFASPDPDEWSATVERTFSRDIDALPEIAGFVQDFLASENLDGSYAFTIDLIIEELFTNMVKYSTEGTNEIPIRLENDGERISIRLTDRDVEPFDVTRAPRVDTGQGLAERKPGGLGIHFVKSLADTIHYDYEERTSVITVTRRLENWHV